MKKGLLYLLLSSSLLLNGQATIAELTDIGYSDEVANGLRAKGMLENLNSGSIQYLPPRALLSQELAQHINLLNPEVVVERLSLIEAKTSDRLELFNSMLQLSSLSGLQYKNAKNKMEPFILGASSIDNPVSVVSKPDDRLPTRPRQFQTFLRQTDSLFGLINYVVDYMSQGDEFAMVLTNLDEIKVQKIFTYAEKGALKTIIYYIPTTDGYLLYSASFNRKEGLGLGSKSNNYKMLSRRLEAYQNWFNARYPMPSGL